MTHRITYITQTGTHRSNILIEADTLEEAENEFKRDFQMEVVKE